jgi:hypothetical protein
MPRRKSRKSRKSTSKSRKSKSPKRKSAGKKLPELEIKIRPRRAWPETTEIFSSGLPGRLGPFTEQWGCAAVEELQEFANLDMELWLARGFNKGFMFMAYVLVGLDHAVLHSVCAREQDDSVELFLRQLVQSLQDRGGLKFVDIGATVQPRLAQALGFEKQERDSQTWRKELGTRPHRVLSAEEAKQVLRADKLDEASFQAWTADHPDDSYVVAEVIRTPRSLEFQPNDPSGAYFWDGHWHELTVWLVVPEAKFDTFKEHETDVIGQEPVLRYPPLSPDLALF